MVDEAPTKRAWFSLHLSTCVVLMVVAGAFLGANMFLRNALSPIKEFSYRHEMKNLENGDQVLVKYVRVHRRRYEFTGWPVVIYEKGESASFEVSRQAEAPRTGVVYTLEMIAEEIGDNFPEKFA
ncbi:MAG: hypothetical protein L6R28_25695, partial [Planctomycetes bacterium]|nr:hypothetical protein [Planctomycetota bacterium]